MLNCFANDNNLVMCDIKRLSNVFTYISDNGLRSYWIDHILSSFSTDKAIYVRLIWLLTILSKMFA